MTEQLSAMLRALPVLQATPPPFDPDTVPANPVELFVRWLSGAIDAGVPEPHAMTLSTCDEDGLPNARQLILKDLDQAGWWFATSVASTKGVQLLRLPKAALTFYWPAQARQIRVRGAVVTASAERGAADFRQRGPGARAAALAGVQSSTLAHVHDQDAAFDDARRRLEVDPDLVQPSWTVFGVAPQQVEFWQAAPDRRHVRLRYTRVPAGPGGDAGCWNRARLWP